MTNLHHVLFFLLVVIITAYNSIRVCTHASKFGVFTQAPCVRQIGIASYLLECGSILIGICCHIYWNMQSYLLEYAVIFIVICCHIYWNMLSYLLEYVILLIIICHHIYLLLYSNSDKNYI